MCLQLGLKGGPLAPSLRYITLHVHLHLHIHLHLHLNYITLHDTTLHHITSHYATLPLHCIALHYITLTLHCITLHYTTLQYIILHFRYIACVHQSGGPWVGEEIAKHCSSGKIRQALTPSNQPNLLEQALYPQRTLAAQLP